MMLYMNADRCKFLAFTLPSDMLAKRCEKSILRYKTSCNFHWYYGSLYSVLFCFVS